jgi:hypothetical protein
MPSHKTALSLKKHETKKKLRGHLKNPSIPVLANLQENGNVAACLLRNIKIRAKLLPIIWDIFFSEKEAWSRKA